MRVCLVTPYTPKEISGVGQVVAELGKGLKKMKQDYTILTRTSTQDRQEKPNLAEIKYFQIRLVGGLFLIIGALYWLLRKRKAFDVLHLHSVSWMTIISGIFGCVLGKPRVLTLHGRFPPLSNSLAKAIFRLEERMAIAFSSMTTCVSKDTKDFYHLDSAVVVLNGIDASRFRPDPEVKKKMRADLNLGDSLVLLFLARWVAHKGIYDLIEVVAGLHQEKTDLKLLLVGSGENEKVLRNIEDQTLEGVVIPVGRVDDVIPYYQASDIYVLFTSPLEGLPLTLLEAMACGVPCIATSVSGITEVISDGVDGFLVGYGDKESLARNIRTSADHRQGLESISEMARQKVEKEFTLSRMTEGYLEIYRAVLKN